VTLFVAILCTDIYLIFSQKNIFYFDGKPNLPFLSPKVNTLSSNHMCSQSPSPSSLKINDVEKDSLKLMM
jgi:hypothetical protein